MRFFLCLCFALQAFPLLADEILVLKNGKQIKIRETYQRQGDLVLFKSKGTNVHQLPAKLVDFERSKQATEEWQANRNKVEPIPAAEAEKIHFVKQSPSTPEAVITIQANDLDSYAQSHPRQVNPAMPASRILPTTSLTDQQALRNSMRGDHKRLSQDIALLRRKLDEAEAKARALDQNVSGRVYYENGRAVVGYDPTAHNRATRARQQADKLKAQLAKYEDDMADLKQRAQRSGVRNVDRDSIDPPKKKAGKPRNRLTDIGGKTGANKIDASKYVEK